MEEEQEREVIVDLKNVSVYQREGLILKDVTLSVHKGEFVYLIGRTGSGKSSLLRTLYADLPLKEGEATIVGHNLKGIKMKEVPFLRRKLGIVFQDYQLLSDRNIHDNLVFVMKATGWTDKKKMDEKIESVLSLVGMKTKGHKMPHQLSGGEQQRVSIARALVNDPELILADEPTGNLDPDTSLGILQLMVDINSTGTAVVMATHNYSFFDRFNSRTLKCEGGVLAEMHSGYSGGY